MFDTLERYVKDHPIVFLFVCGSLYYAYWAFIFDSGIFFGETIYDSLYLALREGRLDLPMRILFNEGHYTEDGKGYIYHGMAPLITRLFLPFGNNGPVMLYSYAPFSVYLWSILGS